MKMIRFFAFVSFCALFCISCDNKKEKNEEWLEKTLPEFDAEYKTIIFREARNHDIKGTIDVYYNTQKHDFVFGCRFTYFNYGDDICLYNGYKNDCFVPFLGDLSFIHVLERKDKIDLMKKNHSEKYGDWALVNITMGEIFATNVFMTPLAMKAYKEGDNDGFIFAQFLGKEMYMNVLFYGGSDDCLVVSNYPQFIIPRHETEFVFGSPDNPGQFWHKME